MGAVLGPLTSTWHYRDKRKISIMHWLFIVNSTSIRWNKLWNILLSTVHLPYLVKNRKFSFKSCTGKLLYLRIWSRFLCTKLIARKCKNFKPYVSNKVIKKLGCQVYYWSVKSRFRVNINSSFSCIWEENGHYKLSYMN